MRWMQQAVYAMRARPCVWVWVRVLLDKSVDRLLDTAQRTSTQSTNCTQNYTQNPETQPTHLERAREAHAERAQKRRKEEASIQLQPLRGRVLPRQCRLKGLLQDAAQAAARLCCHDGCVCWVWSACYLDEMRQARSLAGWMRWCVGLLDRRSPLCLSLRLSRFLYCGGGWVHDENLDKYSARVRWCGGGRDECCLLI